MSNNGDQNGRQLPQQTAPPTDPRLSGVISTDQKKKVCRDFVWGICTKGTQCKFRHELELESMKQILKFCNDYQNRSGCNRPDCTYLHTTRDEKNALFTTGQLPRVLAERHLAISTAAVNNENMPLKMYMNEYPTYTTPNHTAGPTVAAPPPLPLPTLLAPPPPPPPPTTTATPVQFTTPTYTAPPPQNMVTVFPSMSQPPPIIPPIFDASRPPPPLPPNLQNRTGNQKRALQDTSEAVPSKTRKTDDSNLSDGPCEMCIERENRIKLYQQELDKAHFQQLLCKKKLEEYELGKEVLRSVAGPDLYRLLDDYVEGTPQVQLHDMLSQFQSTSYVSGTSTVPRQFLLQLLDCVCSSARNVDPMPSSLFTNEESSLLHKLNALTRRSTAGKDTWTNIAKAMMDFFRKTNLTSERTHEPRTNEIMSSDSIQNSVVSGTSTSGMSGFNRYLESQKPEGTSGNSGNTITPVANRYLSGGVPNSLPLDTVGLNATAAVPQATYVPLPQLTVPPPNVPPYYPHHYPSTAASTSNAVSYNGAVRSSVPAATPAPTLRAATSTPIARPPYNHHFVNGQFQTRPPYFPPFQ